MKRKTSKKTVKVLAVLWTIVALLWAFVAFLRLDDAGQSVGMKAISLVVMAVCLVNCMMHWHRYTHYKDDEY